MKKFLLTLAVIPAAVLASQASAQTYAGANGATNIDNRIANLEARFNAGVQMRAFDQREHQRLSYRLGQLRELERRYAYDGRITTAERRSLQTQIRAVRDEMRMAGGNGWANRYGWTDRDLETYGVANARYDAYGRPMPQSGQVYDAYGRPIPQTYDAYGRPIPQGGYYGQGGAYEPAYNNRSSSGVGNVLGGVLGSVMGGGGGAGGVLGSVLGGGGIGVGSVITGAIASVLGRGNDYGYRDNDRTYFRTDGQQVYEIDARTHQVVRIHPVR
jgi:hypothetical protein